ncbi:4'-phosphopantetheinyl transferase superfamily protein [Demequina silvatica]|uniref:4'-phosphopantetheinyl transferase superfamily protein n=1 Tax=Demequina silvatica TaxID=1638988 RepID=UPI000782BF9C|nr:4'-phosphopantetheinyl transferase superfamily protein [Demequina silvatica]
MTVTVHLAWASVSQGDDARVASDTVARLCVGRAARVVGSSVVLGRRCPRCGSVDHGAPVVRSPVLDVAVSLSRTDGLVVAAAARGVAGVGVDVEASGTVLAAGLADVALAPGESPDPGRDGLLRTWVRKEAVLKAAGTGLATDPRTVRLEACHVAAGPAGPWFLADVGLGAAWVAAVAVRGSSGARVELRDATEAAAAAAAAAAAQAHPATPRRAT